MTPGRRRKTRSCKNNRFRAAPSRRGWRACPSPGGVNWAASSQHTPARLCRAAGRALDGVVRAERERRTECALWAPEGAR